MSAEKIGAVIVCAGKGERTGLDYNKILYPIGHKTLLDMTLEKFAASRVTHVVIVAAERDVQAVARIANGYDFFCAITVGGETRTQSVRNGLNRLHAEFGDDFSVLLVHDGARPFVSPALIDRCIESAERYGSGIAAVKCVDTVRREALDDSVALPRNELYNVQTPQAFKAKALAEAYENAVGEYTDDAQIFELNGGKIRLVDGSYDNIKVTTAADLLKLPAEQRIGIGYDVHRLIYGRPLVLGGVAVPYEKGLLGHSDADVLIHAIMDALLSAAGLPDIGVLFPDTDDRYLGISSVSLLNDVKERVATNGFAVVDISAVIIAQKPKLAPHIENIRKNLAQLLNINASRINISATTTEGLGVVGNGDAIAVNAACILTEKAPQ